MTARADTPTFSEDVNFLKQHTSPTVLSVDGGRAQLIASAEFQGRVMTSTARGLEGHSHGWINRSVVAQEEVNPAGNPYGGEDRIWLAPMGSQFSLFYPPRSEFTDANWRVPPALDQPPFKLVEQSETHAVFRAEVVVTNHGGIRLETALTRRINLFDRASGARCSSRPVLPPNAPRIGTASPCRGRTP